MSNQNAGADRKPCRWCQLWQAAYWASQLPVYEERRFAVVSERLWVAGVQMLARLARRDPGECLGCQKAQSIQLGIHQTPEETAWRAKQWRDNPTVRWMMRAGEHDTFTEAGDET